MPEKEKKIFSTHGISNFKAFKNLEKIEIAPITLIYGQNSGGKSTFLQSILALSQSSKSLIKNKFIFSGKEIDAGTFESIKNKNSQKRSEIIVETSSQKENYIIKDSIKLNCFSPILESKNKIYISKSEDTSIGIVNKIEINFNGYLSEFSLTFNKVISYDLPSVGNEYEFFDGRQEFQRRYDLDDCSYICLSEIINEVIKKATIELNEIKLNFEKNENDKEYIEIDLGFNLRDARLNVGIARLNKNTQNNFIVYQQILNLLKYAAVLSGGWIDSFKGRIRFYPHKKDKKNKTEEYKNLLKEYTNELLNSFLKKISDKKYIFSILVKKKEDLVFEDSNPDNEPLVFSYEHIETDFKLIHNNEEIIFWDEIQNNFQKLCDLQHPNRSKKFFSLHKKLEPIVSEVREISLQIGDINKKFASLLLGRDKYNDSEITKSFAKILKKNNLSKFLDSLKRNNDELNSFFFKIDKNYDPYTFYNRISEGFNIAEKSIKKITYFADNYESILPGNEEYEAFVENRNIGIHLQILQTALFKIYLTSINFLRASNLEDIFKPTLNGEYNSKLFYSSFLFLSNISEQSVQDQRSLFIRGAFIDKYINLEDDFFSLNKKEINFTYKSIINSYESYSHSSVASYLKSGLIPQENINFLPFPFFKKNFIAKELTQEVVHLGPARPAAKRFYTSKDIENASSDDAAFLLKERSETRINIAKLNYYLKSLNILERVRISRSTDKNIVAKKIEVKPIGSNSFVNLADTGYGVSQILPIIINSIFLKQQTIIIQQPETHLHPRLQAEIGSLLSDSISNRRSRRSAPMKKNWIVETHSEIILLRLLKLIRRGELDSNNLRVYYFDNKEKEGSEIKRMHVSKEGELITQWPEGFFSNEIDEVFDI